MLGNEEMSYYMNIKPETIFEFNEVWTEIVNNTGIYQGSKGIRQWSIN